jgi:hypothetical protein
VSLDEDLVRLPPPTPPANRWLRRFARAPR